MGKFLVTGPDGTKYEVNAPDGATQEDAIAYVQKNMAKPPEMGLGIKALRVGEFASRGFTDKAMEAVGAVPDLVASGMRKVGIPAPEEGFYTKGLKEAFDTFGKAVSAPFNAALGDNAGPAKPTNALERGAYGVGGGVADAASMAIPGAMVARGAQAGGTAANVGRTMAANPVMQSVAGGIGGGVSEATGSDTAGLAAALAVPTAANLGRRAITPVGRNLAPEEQRLANLAEQNGIRLTAGQATGSTPLQTMESSFTQLPFTGRTQHGVYDAQRQGFNRAALQHAGHQADRASPAELDAAFKTLGQRFDDAVKATPYVNLDSQFDSAVAKTVQDYGRRLETDVRPVFDSYIDDIAKLTNPARQMGLAGSQVDGQTYKNIASDLRTAARNARNNPALQNALGGLQEALDGAMDRSVTPAAAKLWNATRNHYRNLLQIDNAMALAPAADKAAGNIPFGAFSQKIRGADPRGYARGRGDLNDVSRIGNFLASTKIPDSGTGQRSAMISGLKGAPVVGSGGFMMGGGDLGPAAIAATAAYGLPPLVQALTNSRAGQAYLRNNVAPQMPVAQRREMLAKILATQEFGNAVEK